MKCKITGEKIKPFMSFGKMPMANGFLTKKDFKSEYFYNLEVGYNKKNYLFQINNHPKSNKIFNDKYPFYTNKSNYMKKHFQNFFLWLKKKYLKKNSKIVEIGSNDGTFLYNFKKNKYDCLGFEPSKNVARVAKKKGLKIITEFFDYKTVSNLKKYKNNIDLICAANVICHIPNLNDLIKSVKFLLKDDGLMIFEEPYLGSMFKKISYDQIYDAHVFIFSLFSVREIFKKHGLELIDAYPQKTHGGSMRYVIGRKGNKTISKRVKYILAHEKKAQLNSIKSCLKFKQKCIELRDAFKNKIIKLKKQGKTICGYAASAKSTTNLNYCKLNNNHIDFITDSTEEKIGKFTPGTHIPIVSNIYFRKNFRDYTILNSWNHKNEIKKKEYKYIKKGGKFISHVK